MSQTMVIRFKQEPDRRFRVIPSPERLCGDHPIYTRCAFFNSDCSESYDGAAFEICQRGFFFEEVKE